MADSDKILIGRLGAAHGIKGEVLVISFAEVAEDVAAFGPLADKAGTRTFELSVVRVTPKGVVVRIKGIADRTAAEKLRGIELYVARDKLPATEAGTFYHRDLIGLAAVSLEGREIGRIVAVENFGAGDLIEIRLAGSTRTELVPFDDPHVPEVDLANGRVVVVMPVAAPDDGPDGEREH